MHVMKLLKLSAASFIAMSVFAARYDDLALASGFVTSGEIYSMYLLCLFGSMVTYRTLFHRLREFPGLAFAMVSKLWHVARCFNRQDHILLEKLHQEYGEVVRIGNVTFKNTWNNRQ